VIKGPDAKLHHVAYHIEDFTEILRAADICAIDNVTMDVTPTRHGITRCETMYFFDPAGNRNEVSADGYTTGPDFRTITWTEDQLARGIFYHARTLAESFQTVHS
jgi:catechol 2,3-dioxygenase